MRIKRIKEKLAYKPPEIKKVKVVEKVSKPLPQSKVK